MEKSDGKKNEVSIEMLDGFRTQMTCHKKLVRKYSQISEGLKYFGLISPLWVVVGINWFEIISILGIQIVLWLVLFLVYKKYRQLLWWEESEYKGSWFFLQYFSAQLTGHEWTDWKNL